MTTSRARTPLARCPWANDEPLLRYHDVEWGVPIHDDARHFELLSLEGAQAGLSWRTVLIRREGYRAAYADFDLESVARFTKRNVNSLVKNEGVIRHRAKLESVIENAKAILRLKDHVGSFDTYVWKFVDGSPIIHRFSSLQKVPATSPLSEALSKDLKFNGLRFVGPTICYSYLQAAGLVMDHLTSCPRWQDLC